MKKFYVTDDNPRNEDPKKIRVRQLRKKLIKQNLFEVADRSKAIQEGNIRFKFR